MTLRRIQVFAVAVVLATLLLASSVAQPTDRTSATPAADWTFEGCWTQFASGPCRDIYRDDQGNFGFASSLERPANRLRASAAPSARRRSRAGSGARSLR